MQYAQPVYATVPAAQVLHDGEVKLGAYVPGSHSWQASMEWMSDEAEEVVPGGQGRHVCVVLSR